MGLLRHLPLTLLLLAAMAAAACDSEDAAPPSPSDSSTPAVAASPTPTLSLEGTATPTFEAELPEELLQSMREDLVESRVLNPIDTIDNVVMIEVVEITSTDECLPLPKPADCPPQEMVPGYRVTLRRTDFGVDYFYYTDGRERRAGAFGLPLPSPTPVSPDMLPQPLLTLLRDHLSKKVNVPSASIEVAAVDEAVWGGCYGVPQGPDAGGPCGPIGLMLGYEITLTTAGKEYRYHAMREEPYQFVGPIGSE